MAHGHPDYGGYAPATTIYTIQDMAELAARLGSIVTFDRRGNIILLEDFEGSLAKWVADDGGGDGSITVSAEKARSGSFSCRMRTVSGVGEYCVLKVRLAYPIASKMGLEGSWHQEQNLSELRFNMRWYDGTTAWLARVAWLEATGTWKYYDSAGNWIALSPTVSYYEGETQFNTTKLVADFADKKYVRLIANNVVYDLSDLPLYSAASAISAQLAYDIQNYSDAAAGCIIFLDDVIITQNEP